MSEYSLHPCQLDHQERGSLAKFIDYANRFAQQEVACRR